LVAKSNHAEYNFYLFCVAAIKNYATIVNMSNNNLKVIDLFAGVGGLSLGAVRAGFSLQSAVELDQHACMAHSLNFPNSLHIKHDISQLTGQSLLKMSDLVENQLAGLIGGPPCQGFSTIGHRNTTDPRNNLFVHFFKLVSETLPLFFVAENVPGILDDKFKQVREEALSYVKQEYKLSDPIKLKASDFGAPTNRERIFFIGHRLDAAQKLTIRDFESRKTSHFVNVSMALQGLPLDISSTWLTEEQSWQLIESLPESDYANYVQRNVPKGVGNPEALSRFLNDRLVSGCFGTRHSPQVAERYGKLKQGEQDRVSKSVRLRSDGFCPTLRAGTGPERGSYQAVRPIHPIEPRVITPREAARLQGFPDWFRFSPSKWHSFRQIGNSVSPILAQVIFEVIYNHLYLTTGVASGG